MRVNRPAARAEPGSSAPAPAFDLRGVTAADAPVWQAAPHVMLLSLWSAPESAWQVRLVAPDAEVHIFTSPFELARFLSQPQPRAVADNPRSLK